MKEELILAGERVDDLQLKGLKIIQNPEGFCFGIDAVLLSNFAEIKKNATVVDLCTGTGIVPLLVAGKSQASKIYGIEIQNSVADMAQRSVKLNGLEERVEIIEDDLKKAFNHLSPGSVDVVTCNPPYIASGGGILNPHSYKAISRHEVLCTLEDVIASASKLLCNKGTLFMVHRPSRLIDISYLARKYGLEPKIIRFVQPKANKKPNILLVKCVKGGNPELKFMDPLIVYEEDGDYTQEIYKIYNNENIDVFNKG